VFVRRAGMKIYINIVLRIAAYSSLAGELHELTARIGGIGHQ
jgi:hypothetical protein